MTPGAFIAVGAVVLAVGWLLWEFWRAPEMEEPEPIRRDYSYCEDEAEEAFWRSWDRDDFEMGVLARFDGDQVPARRRHG